MCPIDQSATAKAPGKLVLFGEYAVLEGYTALVASVNRYAKCTITAGSDFSLSSTGFGSFNASNLDRAPSIIQAIFREPPYPKAHVDIQSTELFLDGDPTGCKLGLGSSAAVSTSLLKTLSLWTETHQSLTHIFSAAHTAHHSAQGLGSGLDIASAVFGGVFQYQLQVPAAHQHSSHSVIMAAAGDHVAQITRRTIHPECPILGVHLGQAASTPKFVRAVHALRAERPKAYSNHMAVLGQISREACAAWDRHNVRALMDYCTRNNQALKALGEQAEVEIVPPRLEALNSSLKAIDTVAKTTGAGGGDMAWVVCTDPAHAKDIQRHLSEDWSVHVMQAAPESSTSL